MAIRVLPDTVIDRIAAGEVVERPAAVVKELVENALDAGAHQLDVRLGGGGATLIQIRDDGCGMDRDDALLCLERHATSKIQDEGDLVGVRTLGFRGEAIPSIASVSRFTLRTRRAEDEVGTEVRVDGGTLEHVGPVASPPGTEITVRALFHHVPARRKFLRSAQTELEHVTEVITRQVLLRPDVDVRVVHDGREVLRAPVTTDPVRRLRDLLGPEAESLVEVSADVDGVTVRGWASPVGVHRPTSTGAVYTYVNGRFVRDAVVRRAVSEAYRGALPPGRHPVVVLSVDVDGESVDVNVHPAKTEVRFRAPSDVVRVVGLALREALRVLPVPSATERRRAAGPDLFSTRRDDDDLRVPVSGLPPGLDWSAPPTPTPVPVPVPLPVPENAPPAPPPPPSPTSTPPPEPSTAAPLAAAPPTSPPRLLHHLGRYALLIHHDTLSVLDVPAWWSTHARACLALPVVDSVPLLVPRSVELGRSEAGRVAAAADALAALGLDIAAHGPGVLVVLAVPSAFTVDPEAALRAVAAAVDAGRDLAAALAGAAVPPEGAALLDALGLVDWAPFARVVDEATLASWVRG